jgi:hypothetical protein
MMLGATSPPADSRGIQRAPFLASSHRRTSEGISLTPERRRTYGRPAPCTYLKIILGEHLR